MPATAKKKKISLTQLHEEVASLRKDLDELRSNPPKPRERRFGRRRAQQTEREPATPVASSLPVASKEREDKLITMANGWYEKRMKWEKSKNTDPPGYWYFSELGSVIEFAAAGPMPRGFGRVYRLLCVSARLMLKQWISEHPIARQYPSDALVSESAGMVHAISSIDNPDEVVESFDRFAWLREAAAAIADARQGDKEKALIALEHWQTFA